MSKRAVPTDGQIYPKRYFDASKTWYNWNKLTASDIHSALRTEPGFEGQNVYFYLNHPIQFVRIVGLLVDIEQKLEGKYTILTIDDSSGACINVKIDRREITKGDNAEYPSNTTVDNVDVHVTLGQPTVYLDIKPLSVGDVLEIKGIISTFRGTRQLDLKRMFAIKDTNAEAKAWMTTARWKRDVLAKSWVLDAHERVRIDNKIEVEEREERRQARRKKEWHAKHGEKKRAHEEKRETRRKAAEVKYNAGALKGSHVIYAPWD